MHLHATTKKTQLHKKQHLANNRINLIEFGILNVTQLISTIIVLRTMLRTLCAVQLFITETEMF